MTIGYFHHSKIIMVSVISEFIYIYFVIFSNRSHHRSATFAGHLSTEYKSIGQWADQSEFSIEKFDQYAIQVISMLVILFDF
jgi:hypothetical protein